MRGITTIPEEQLIIYGNVCEWVQDWYGEYSASSVTDPRGPSSGSRRVNRGGSWYELAWDFHSAFRGHRTPDVRVNAFGFRPALSPEQQA